MKPKAYSSPGEFLKTGISVKKLVERFAEEKEAISSMREKITRETLDYLKKRMRPIVPRKVYLLE